MKRILFVFFSLVLLSCKAEEKAADPSLFQSQSGESQTDTPSTHATDDLDNTEDSGSITGGDRKGSKSDGGGIGRAVTEDFTFGGRHILADFLFVVDNSISMKSGSPSYVQKVRDGLLSLSPDLFQKDSKIAVMTSMTGQYDNLSTTHAGIARYAGIDLEPGFLSLVNRLGLNSFITQSPPPAYTSSYPLEVCEQSWFGQLDQNGSGQSCFEAALQNPLSPVGCEAGLNAVDQLLTKHSGSPIFREGAFAQVIFISDEAHPGCTNQDIITHCPSFAKLKAGLEANSHLSGFKLHGIVNYNEGAACPILPVLDDSGGNHVDIRTTTDYAPIFKEIVLSTTPEQGVFALHDIAYVLNSVTLDGALVPATLSVDGKVVTVQNLNSYRVNHIRIEYIKLR